MLESSTNLTSTRLLVDLMKMVFSEPWTGNVLLFILIFVTAVLFIVETKLGREYKHIERIQQEYANLLKPGEVKLEYDRGELKHSHQDDLDWDDFIGEVKRQRKYRKYKLQDLYEKAEKAFKGYNKSVESVYDVIKTISIDRLKRESFSFVIWDGERSKPLTDYIDTTQIPVCITNVINGHPLTIEIGRDGRYMLQCPSTIAKATSEDKIHELKELFEKVANDDTLKESFAKRDKAKEDMEQALKDYNGKLSEAIRDLRMFPHQRFLK